MNCGNLKNAGETKETMWQVRVLRVADHVAELLETEANKVPPSFKTEADILRKAAMSQRESPNLKLTNLWEAVPTEKSAGQT